MTVVPRALWLVVVLSACAPRGDAAARRAALAARADSSAAGYAVGAMPSAPAAASPATPVHLVSAATVPVAPRAVPAVSGAAHPREVPVAHDGHATPSSGSARHTVPDTAAHDSVRRDPSPAPTAPPAPPVGRVRVNDALSFDAGLRTVFLRLVAGETGVNHALNFNGGARGGRRVTVPVGWRVTVAFANHDSDLPHSAVVIPAVDPLPVEPPPPAFPGAATPAADKGFMEGGSGEMSFVAATEGHYLIVCGVPGHAEGGQWIRLDVTPSASLPSYQ